MYVAAKPPPGRANYIGYTLTGKLTGNPVLTRSLLWLSRDVARISQFEKHDEITINNGNPIFWVTVDYDNRQIDNRLLLP